MFEPTRPKNNLMGGMHLLSLIYHATIRNVRQNHGNAIIGLIMSIMQTVVFVVAFYFMFSVLGLRGSAIRGDFLLFLMSGIFLFLTHNKALGSVVSSEGPASAMMKHAPMNTIVAITSSALATLYLQLLAMGVVLLIYHVAFTPITIFKPIPAMGMVLLAWFSGAAIGTLLLALKPWFPGFVGIVSTIYQRANMIASGKMFVANAMPGFMIAWFDWNPLFHTIDQARGFVFLNYNPHYSNTTYPLILSVALLMIGLMGESYTRKHASISWNASR